MEFTAAPSKQARANSAFNAKSPQRHDYCCMYKVAQSNKKITS